MAITKTPTTMISNQTIAANSSIVSAASVDLTTAITLEIGLVCTFNTATSNGLQIDLLSDPTSADASFPVSSSNFGYETFYVQNQSGTVKRTFPATQTPRFLKVRVTNLGNQSITACSVYATIQTL